LCAITDNDVYVLLDWMMGWGVKGRGGYTDIDCLLILTDAVTESAILSSSLSLHLNNLTACITVFEKELKKNKYLYIYIYIMTFLLSQ